MPPLTAANDLIRARNVSASECYALLGKHPYATPQSIYDRLSTPADFGHPEQTEAMAIGVYMEPYVARYAARRLGLRLRANSRTIEHKTVNLCATPDYLVLGESILVEVKVSGIMYGWTEGELHPHYEYQARAQMACTGRDTVIIAALVGSRLFTPVVTRDLDKEERLLQAVDKFFNEYVMPGIRPDASSTKVVATVTQGG